MLVKLVPPRRAANAVRFGRIASGAHLSKHPAVHEFLRTPAKAAVRLHGIGLKTQRCRNGILQFVERKALGQERYDGGQSVSRILRELIAAQCAEAKVITQDALRKWIGGELGAHGGHDMPAEGSIAQFATESLETVRKILISLLTGGLAVQNSFAPAALRAVIGAATSRSGPDRHSHAIAPHEAGEQGMHARGEVQVWQLLGDQLRDPCRRIRAVLGGAHGSYRVHRDRARGREPKLARTVGEREDDGNNQWFEVRHSHVGGVLKSLIGKRLWDYNIILVNYKCISCNVVI